MKQMAKKISLLLLSAVILSGTGYFSFQAYAGYHETRRKERSALQQKKAAWRQLKQYVDRETSHYRGKAGIVIKDLETGWEYAYQCERLFPSASIVKIPIMAAVFQAAHEGRISMDQMVTMRGVDQVQGSGILKGQPAGSQYSVRTLTALMITRSDNTAANLLIQLLGRKYLNSYFASIGLHNTNLSRDMMDFRKRRNGIENYTTSRDISLLLEKMYKGTFINTQVSRQCLALLKRQKVKDRIPRMLPRDVVVAHKTGLERSVCHDAGIVFTENGDFLICVLTKSRCDFRVSKEFIARLAAYAYHTYKMKGG